MSSNMLRGISKEIELDKYYHQPGMISDHKNILNDIEHIVRFRSEISDSSFVSRVFINNGTRDDLGFRVSNNPPKGDEGLENWLKRITEAESFCAVINGVNGWSESISSRIFRDFSMEWVNTFGIPSQGVDVYTFMGKYNITPFGIHKDREHTFLYHLGPGIKNAWLWDPNIVDIAPIIRSDSFNLSDTLGHAHAITLRPGDGLFIPQGWYHVLENPEFSVTLGVAPYEKRKSELLVSFIKSFISENNRGDEDTYIHISNDANTSDFSEIILSESNKKITLESLVTKGIEDLTKSLKSNFFFKYKSPPRIPKNKVYHYYGGFIVGNDDGEHVTVHCRGGTLTFKSDFNPQLIKINSVLKSEEFSYERNGYDEKNFLQYIFEHLIKFGVLV